MLIQIAKKPCPGPRVMSFFLCGLLSICESVVSLCVARAIAFRVKVEGPKAPACNISAFMLLVCCLAGEVIEDSIVTREMLRISPAGAGLLRVNAEGDNAHPAADCTGEPSRCTGG